MRGGVWPLRRDPLFSLVNLLALIGRGGGAPRLISFAGRRRCERAVCRRGQSMRVWAGVALFTVALRLFEVTRNAVVRVSREHEQRQHQQGAPRASPECRAVIPPYKKGRHR